MGPAPACGPADQGPQPAPPAAVLQLATELEKGVPVEESILLPKLRELLVNEFGAKPRAA